MIHQADVLLKARRDVLGGVRPADASKAGHPARNGDVAEVAAAVDERRVGKQGGEQSQMNVIVGHLVDDPRGFAAVELDAAGRS